MQDRNLDLKKVHDNINTLLDCCGKIESIGADLSINKLDPACISLMRSVRKLFDDIVKMLQSYEPFFCNKKITALSDNECYALSTFNREMSNRVSHIQSRYNAILTEVATVLNAKRGMLTLNLTLFSESSRYKEEAEKAKLRDKAGIFVTQLDAPNPNPKKALKHYVNLQKNIQQVARKPLQRFNNLFSKIDDEPETNDRELKQIRLQIKSVISNYIYASSGWFNLFFNRRAASPARVAQMEEILDLANKSDSGQGLRISVRIYLMTMPAFSDLANHLREIVNPLQTLEMQHMARRT